MKPGFRILYMIKLGNSAGIFFWLIGRTVGGNVWGIVCYVSRHVCLLSSLFPEIMFWYVFADSCSNTDKVLLQSLGNRLSGWTWEFLPYGKVGNITKAGRFMLVGGFCFQCKERLMSCQNVTFVTPLHTWSEHRAEGTQLFCSLQELYFHLLKVSRMGNFFS